MGFTIDLRNKKNHVNSLLWVHEIDFGLRNVLFLQYGRILQKFSYHTLDDVLTDTSHIQINL